MELKVWVEGIQRVICGVTDATTCQDVVIALAHATGKTGRFTLVERWRDNERLIAPSENPLRVLQKWGEYSSDVQFILRHSDQRKDKKDGTKPKDKFLHNFKPHTETLRQHGASIKKSLTFSGAHGSYPLPGASGKSRIKRSNHETLLSSLDEMRSSSTSVSSKSTPSPHGTLEKKSKQSSLPIQTVPPFSSHSHSSSTWSAAPHFAPQSLLPLHPHPHHQRLLPTGLLQDSRTNSMRQDLPPARPEEYDLDKHLAHTNRLSKAFNGDSFSEEEFRAKVSAGASKSDLARLVHLQSEKLAVQKSQLSNVDSEIAYWEQRERDFVSDQQRINEEDDILRATNLALAAEVEELDATAFPATLQAEQQKQRTLETELALLRSRLANAEAELVTARNKIHKLTSELDKENSLIQQQKCEQRDAELKTLQDISDVQKNLNLSLATHESNLNDVEEIMKQIHILEKDIAEKKKEIVDLEGQLRDTNLQVFMTAPVSPTPEAAEHYVFSRLSPTRPGSARKMTQSPSFLKEAVATPKNPHGLWV